MKILAMQVAIRASQLADMPINDVRSLYPITTNTQSELIQYCKQQKFTRGQLIRTILQTEFDDDS